MAEDRLNAEHLSNEQRTAAIEAEAMRARAAYAPETCEPPRRRRHGPGHRLRRARRIALFVLLGLILVAAIFLFPRIRAALAPEVSINLPDSLAGLLPDEKMGYSKIDFSDIILGESRKKSDFVILEQDVTVVSRVSQALANLVLFEKSQIIRSYGTGVYTVDLSKLAAADVVSDDAMQIVSVTIPHAALAYIEVDVARTEFEDTKKALFAFGEIKLTNEQQNTLEQSIRDAMREQLDTDRLLTKADEHALAQTRALFEPLVQAVAPDYIVKVLMPESPSPSPSPGPSGKP